MKAFQVIRDVIVIIACLCVIGATAEVLIIRARVSNVVDQINDSTDPGPVPSVTGCPFGPDQCGG